MGTPVPAPLAQADGDSGHTPIGPCAFCGHACDEDDYCPGCRVFVCERCDQRPRLADVIGPSHARGLHGAVERREVMREVERGRAALRDGRIEEATGALNSIEALLRT